MPATPIGFDSTSSTPRSWWDPRGWSQDTQNVLLGGAISGVGSYLSNRSQGAQNEADRELSREQFRERMELDRQALAQALQLGQMGNQLSRDQMSLQSTQMDPLAHQKSRQGNALRAALLQGGPPQMTRGNDAYKQGQFQYADLSSANPFF